MNLFGTRAYGPLYQAIQPGGGKRDRTADLLLAKQALSRLSYTPVGCLRNLEQQGRAGGPR